MAIICGKEYDDASSVKNLRLSSMGLTDLNGSELLQFPNVEVLDLFENRLICLPDEINQLKNLRILRINNNRLVSLPDFSNLTQLEEINVTNNYLNDIHYSIFKLPRMQKLYIGGNYISPNTYLNTGFTILCASQKTTEFIDSTPSNLNLQRSSEDMIELRKINRKNANKSSTKSSVFENFDDYIYENVDVVQKTFNFMYELIARSATIVIDSTKEARINATRLRKYEDDVTHNAHDKSLRQINGYMFDLTDKASDGFDSIMKETKKYVSQMEQEKSQLQLQLSNLTLKNEKLVEHNKTLTERHNSKNVKDVKDVSVKSKYNAKWENRQIRDLEKKISTLTHQNIKQLTKIRELEQKLRIKTLEVHEMKQEIEY